MKSIADFLLYPFQDRKLQPSTIYGYRSAIADKLGNLPINVSKDENLTLLVDSFHRPETDQKVDGVFPPIVLTRTSDLPLSPHGSSRL